MIDQNLLKRYLNAFIMFEIANHGADPRESLEGTTLRIPKKEGYKFKNVSQWRDMIHADGHYIENVLQISQSTNLIDYHTEDTLGKNVTGEKRSRLEAALSKLYQGSDDEDAFRSITGMIGRRFDLLGFLFFLKDSERYMPIKPELFDERFRFLDVDSNLSGNCSWEKYQEYNAAIAEVHAFLTQYLNPDVKLIDAHSFLWILPDLQLYLDRQIQSVEHAKYGKGVVLGFENNLVIVQFGKQIRKFNNIAAFDKGLLRLLPTPFDLDTEKKKIRAVDNQTKQINDEEDEKLVSELKHDGVRISSENAAYAEGPMPKPEPVLLNSHLTYPRSRQTACNALRRAQYQCEINPDHPTFIRRSSNAPYTEPHHLVPMAYQEQMEVLLDWEQNIVSLCSNCHNELHYGRDAKKLIQKLYNNRKDQLIKIGIELSLEELLELYD